MTNKLDKQIKSILESTEKFIINDELFEAQKQVLVSQIKQSILKAIMGKLNILMPDKRIEEIEGNLNIYLGETHCTVCGADPRRQKAMIESVIKEILK